MRFQTPFLLLLVSFPVHAAVQLSSLVHGGSACPPGSVSASVAPDGSALTILYSGFEARVGSGQDSDQKDCTVTLKIRKPLLAALVLESADFRGFVGLEPGVVARQKINVTSGYGGRYLLNQQFAFSDFVGPVSENYLIQSFRPVQLEGNLVDCASQIRKDTKFQFQTKLRLDAQPGRQGLFTVDSTDGRMVQSYRFRLVNCLRELPFGR